MVVNYSNAHWYWYLAKPRTSFLHVNRLHLLPPPNITHFRNIFPHCCYDILYCVHFQFTFTIYKYSFIRHPKSIQFLIWLTRILLKWEWDEIGQGICFEFVLSSLIFSLFFHFRIFFSSSLSVLFRSRASLKVCVCVCVSILWHCYCCCLWRCNGGLVGTCTCYSFLAHIISFAFGIAANPS